MSVKFRIVEKREHDDFRTFNLLLFYKQIIHANEFYDKLRLNSLYTYNGKPFSS